MRCKPVGGVEGEAPRGAEPGGMANSGSVALSEPRTWLLQLELTCLSCSSNHTIDTCCCDKKARLQLSASRGGVQMYSCADNKCSCHREITTETLTKLADPHTRSQDGWIVEQLPEWSCLYSLDSEWLAAERQHPQAAHNNTASLGVREPLFGSLFGCDYGGHGDLPKRVLLPLAVQGDLRELGFTGTTQTVLATTLLCCYMSPACQPCC